MTPFVRRGIALGIWAACAATSITIAWFGAMYYLGLMAEVALTTNNQTLSTIGVGFSMLAGILVAGLFGLFGIAQGSRLTTCWLRRRLVVE